MILWSGQIIEEKERKCIFSLFLSKSNWSCFLSANNYTLVNANIRLFFMTEERERERERVEILCNNAASRGNLLLLLPLFCF